MGVPRHWRSARLCRPSAGLRMGRLAPALLLALAVAVAGADARAAAGPASGAGAGGDADAIGTPPAHAAPMSDRAAIARERHRLQGAFDAEEAACRVRFAVNDCTESVRQRRRDALAPLRERELALAEAERRERAAERRRSIRARQEAALHQLSPASAPLVHVRPAASAASAASARSRQAKPQAAPDVLARERQVQAAERAAASERRREQTRAAQQRIEQRLRERAAGGRESAPLPPPPAAPQR